MHREQVTMEGIHVEIRDAWREVVDREIAHLEKQHPRVFTRVAVRFSPIKPHHPGMKVSIHGRIEAQPFDVEREGHDVLSTLHEAFAIVHRTLQDRAKRSHHAKADAVPSEMAAEEAIVEAEQNKA